MGIFQGIEDVNVPPDKHPAPVKKTTPFEIPKYEKEIQRTTHRGEREFYKVRQILELVKRRLKDAGIRTAYINKSKRGVPYISFYKRVGGRMIKFGVCWFAGSKTRSFRGFKLFFYPSHNQQIKKKFPAPGGNYVPGSEGDPRLAIVQTVKNLINFIEETSDQIILQCVLDNKPKPR